MGYCRFLSACFTGILLASPLAIAPASAGKIQYCYPVEKSRTLRDPGSHPQAYDDGYREGAAAARENKPFEPRSAGGEFARGFEDGYYGRTYGGQHNVVPDRTDTYTTNQCRTYEYNDGDSVEQTLKRVLDDFQRDLRRDWNINVR